MLVAERSTTASRHPSPWDWLDYYSYSEIGEPVGVNLDYGLAVRLLGLQFHTPVEEENVAYDGNPNRRGRWCFGKTPMQTFLDAIQIAKEKMIAA